MREMQERLARLQLKTFSVIASPNKKKTRITKIISDTVYVDVHATPENNKANDELVRYLSKVYKPVKIISGKTSKKKLLKVL